MTTKYYQKIKKRPRKEARERFQNLSEGEKNKRYQNVSEEDS